MKMIRPKHQRTKRPLPVTSILPVAGVLASVVLVGGAFGLVPWGVAVPVAVGLMVGALIHFVWVKKHRDL